MSNIRRRVLTLALCLGLTAAYASWVSPTSAADPVLVGAGDIANCSLTGDEATANLLDNIDGTVFTVGDNAYPDGTAADYNNCYGPSWGRHKARTRPSPGNHEYRTSGASGYFGYYGANAGPPNLGYYSYDVGTWHIVSLNSEVSGSAMSAQIQWLKDDLAAHPAACTLSYWHQPVFSSGEHGNVLNMQEIWKVLHEHGADVVLNGHDHDYERFAPQNPYGLADPNGMREFIVGTGGAEQRDFVTIRPNSEVRNSETFGVLKLTLHATSYDWQFVPIAGQSFSDTGSAACYTGTNLPATPTATATPPPAGQTQLTLAPAADTYVDQAKPTSSYATNSEIKVVDGSGASRQGFLRFTVSGLPPGATILSAQLQLYVTNGSDSGGVFKRVSNTTWPETITWNTKPAIDGAQLAALGSVLAGEIVNIDVKPAITGNGSYSFAITLPSGETDGLGYASDENVNGAPAPRLTILAQTGAPANTVTPTHTGTPTNISTSTVTSTPTATPSPTDQPTGGSPTSTSTPTITNTPSATPTQTLPPVNTPTPAIAGTWSFGPVADTYVSQSNAGNSYGGTTSFSIVGGSTSAKQAFIRFTVASLPAGAVVQAAKLRLFVTNDSTSGGIINQITNTSWAESINWNSRPPIDGAQLAVLGPVALNSTVEINLAGAVTGNGSYSFAISLPTTNGNTLGYASKEANTISQRPQLIMTTAGGTTPTLTNTPTPTNLPTSTATATPVGSTSTATATPVSTATATVTPPAGSTLNFGPIADAYVAQSSPDSANNGSSISVVGGSSSAKQAFIRFTVSGLPAGAVVQAAKLRLFVTNDSTSGGVFNRISNTSWSENITWNTKPAIDGPVVTTLGAVALNSTVEINLGGIVTGDGSYSFAISLPNANTNTLGYASREASTISNRPQLIITLQ
jgi:hypothetical protein